MAVALPASAAGPWGAPQADEPTGDCPGCGHYQHQNSGGQPDEPAGDCDRDRLRLRDGSCGPARTGDTSGENETSRGGWHPSPLSGSPTTHLSWPTRTVPRGSTSPGSSSRTLPQHDAPAGLWPQDDPRGRPALHLQHV